jgi:hypothetical protein
LPPRQIRDGAIVSAAWQRTLGTVNPTESLAFQSTGAGFTISGLPLARDAALLESGIDLRVMPGFPSPITHSCSPNQSQSRQSSAPRSAT